MNHSVRTIFVRSTAGIAILLGLTFAVSASAQGIFRDADSAAITNKQFAKTMVENRENALRTRYVTLDGARVADAIATKKAGGDDVLELNLFPDVHFLAKVESIEVRGDVFTLQSRIDAKVFGRARLTVSKAGVLGQVHVDDQMFEIALLPDGTSAIIEVDLKYPMPEELEVPEAPARSIRDWVAAKAPRLSEKTQLATIDVLIVFPWWFYAPYCDIPDLNAAVAADYESSLDAYMNLSSMPLFNVDFNVTVDCETSVMPSGSLSTDLSTIRTDSAIKSLRNQHAADMVSMIVPSGDAAGIGYAGQGGVGSGYAYSVVVQSYALNNYSLHHELGHNFGMYHDRAHASDNDPNYCYYGKKLYSSGSEFGRTIMSYGSSTRYPIFTNPAIIAVNGIPTSGGEPCGTGSGGAFNTQQLWNRAATVANFK